MTKRMPGLAEALQTESADLELARKAYEKQHRRDMRNTVIGGLLMIASIIGFGILFWVG